METPIYLLSLFIIACTTFFVTYIYTKRQHLKLQNQYTEQHKECEWLNRQLSHLRDEKQQIETDYKDLEQTHMLLRITESKLKANEANLQEKLNTQIQAMEDNKKTLETQFENLANRIFEEKNKTFSERSQQNLTHLLTPLRNNIKDFERLVTDNFNAQAKEQFSLKNEISRIVNVNEKMTTTTENLTKALKSDNKTQGNWGEIILEKILKEAGLRENEDYTVQGRGMEMKDPETQGHLKPDIIVNLPENKHIIIDSKMSLTHYEAYINTENPTDKKEFIKKFLNSIKNHVRDLSQKKYHANEKIISPDFTLMFVPIEGAYMLAMHEDNNLYADAWNKRIVITSATMLFATLRTISSLWRLEKQSKNAQIIAEKGGRLYDKIHSFIKDMDTLGRHMQTTQTTYTSAMNKLQTGKGNILDKTKELEELGVKNTKQLSQRSDEKI